MVSISKEAQNYFRPSARCTFIAPCAPLLLNSGKKKCGVGALASRLGIESEFLDLRRESIGEELGKKARGWCNKTWASRLRE
jgi:hypothetical protein